VQAMKAGHRHAHADYKGAAEAKGYRVEYDDTGMFYYYVDQEGKRSFGFGSQEGAWRAACEDNGIAPVETQSSSIRAP
jgi:hypothetical protein